ncbi:hypothetical protein M433DRAFT_157370 [Acidomyces richmondensis BFW]|nr:MAG: hypothetical protein FE78DRAFT_94733 [Acidomyces sp. 'richmondensis']KYG42884.1 hypothetical protein M433DRAFT_157370 [Acidomyces richmondensis BFW]
MYRPCVEVNNPKYVFPGSSGQHPLDLNVWDVTIGPKCTSPSLFLGLLLAEILFIAFQVRLHKNFE